MPTISECGVAREPPAPAVVGTCFGRGHYGAILGWMMPLLIGAQAIAIPLVGAVRDATGDYPFACSILIGPTSSPRCASWRSIGAPAHHRASRAT